MQWLVSIALSSLVLAPGRPIARNTIADEPPAPTAPSPVTPEDREARTATVALGQQAWSNGEYGRARETLQPLADGPFSDGLERQLILTTLADCTLNDASLPIGQRTRDAQRYLSALMDEDPTWQMPPNTYTAKLFDLYVELGRVRLEASEQQCRTDLNACQADADKFDARLARLQTKYDDLKARYEDQEVEVRNVVARSRILAAIPFGVGHFYSGNRALAWTFLSAEAVFGAAGLGLLLRRTIVDGCERTAGFSRQSLRCRPNNSSVSRSEVVQRRKAEEAMGWAFLGTIIVDIVVGQALFKDVETVKIDRVRRSELDKRRPPGNKRKRRTGRKRRAKVRPASTVIPGGSTLGVDIRF